MKIRAIIEQKIGVKKNLKNSARKYLMFLFKNCMYFLFFMMDYHLETEEVLNFRIRFVEVTICVSNYPTTLSLRTLIIQ